MSNAPTPPSGRDRRASLRYPVTPDGFGTENTCRPVTAKPDESWSALVRDLSTGGLGLLVNRRFEPGTLLIVDVQDAEQTISRSMLVRVVHAVREKDNAWALGCSFPTPLSEAELLSLM